MTETPLHIRHGNRLAIVVYLCTAGMAAYIIFTAISVFCGETGGLTLMKYLAAALLLCALSAALSRLGRNETRHVLCLLAAAFAIRCLFIRLVGRTKNQSFADAAVAGAVLSLSNAARPTAIVFVLALAAYAVASCFGDKGELRRVLVRTVLAVVCYFLCMSGISALVKASGVNRNGLSNLLPEWKFIVGLNQSADGQYNLEDVSRVFHAQNQTRAAQALERERLEITAPQFFALAHRKALLMWGTPEADYWAFTGSVCDGLTAVYGKDALVLLAKVQRMTAALYVWIYMLIALGGFAQARKKRISEVYLLLALTALAYFCAHAFIEIQPRYRTLMYSLTFPLTANGTE